MKFRNNFRITNGLIMHNHKENISRTNIAWKAANKLIQSAASVASVAILLAFFNPSQGLSEVIPLSQTNEINGDTEYTVGLTAMSYRRITDEDFLMLTCKPDGTVTVDFHYGYQVSGVRLNPRDIITVKFDNDEPIEMTLRSFSGKRILDEVRRASTMLVKVPNRIGTFRFNLSGSTRALIPFDRQCSV